MLIYEFNGTQNGLLTCLFESFTRREKPYMVTSGAVQITFDSELTTIATDVSHAEKVRAAIVKYGSITLLNRLFLVLRSADPHRETAVFNAAWKCLDARRDMTTDFADPDIIAFDDLSRKIRTEIHRMKGFVRFEESADGVWYAHFEPDNDIVDLVAPHFLGRLGEKFILHDVRRNKISISDGKRIFTFLSDRPLVVYLSPRETELKKLWITYYDSVNIPERKNERLMRGYMPRRYDKHLPERNRPLGT